MQVLTDTYGRILTQHDPDGDVRTAVVWVPGDSRIDWDDASDQELVTLLGKYGYNDALTIEDSYVTLNTNGETETLTWDSVAMDFTADVEMFQNGAQNMYFRTVNDGSRNVTVLCDADGKAIVAPTLGEYTDVLFSVANNGSEIDTITSDSSISAAAVIQACGGSVNVTVLDAGDSVFLLVLGTHIQYCNGDNTTTSPTVTPSPISNVLFYNYDPVAQENFLCDAAGKLLVTPDGGSNKYFICDSNGVFNSLGLIPNGLNNRYGVSEVIRQVNSDGWSFVLDDETIEYDGSELSVKVSKFKGAIPVIGDLQVFKNQTCSEYYDGGVTDRVFARLNRKSVSGFEWAADNMDEYALLYTPSFPGPGTKYGLYVYGFTADGFKASSDSAYPDGAVITCISVEERNVGNPKLIFSYN